MKNVSSTSVIPTTNKFSVLKDCHTSEESPTLHAYSVSDADLSGHILIKLKCANRLLLSFVDSGSEISLIKKSVANILIDRLNLKVHSPDIIINSVSNHEIDIAGFINLPISLGKQRLYSKFYIVEEAHFAGCLLIGSDFCHKANAKIFCGQQKKVVLLNVPHKYKLLPFNSEYINSISCSKKSNDLNSSIKVKAVGNYKLQPTSISSIKVCLASFLPVTKSLLIEDCTHFEDEYKIARSVNCISSNKQFSIFCINTSQNAKVIKNGDVVAKALSVDLLEDKTPDLSPSEIQEQVENLDLSHLDVDQQQQVRHILLEKSKVFSTKNEPIGHIDIVEHSLDIPEGQISYVPQYRQPKACEEAMSSMINELLHYKVIKECESPFNSPILMVRKPDDSWRFCIDMRKLNQITPFKPYPIPKITDNLNKLSGMQYFSSLDAKSGYHHIKMKEEDKIKTAFRTNDCTYCFERMPFGLKNAGFTYQMAMNKMLFDVLGKYALVYIDDIVIYSKDFKTHMKHLKSVFDILIKGGVKLTMKKCVFAKTSIKYLGFIVDGSGISPNPAKISAFKTFPVPTNQKQIKQFLASVGFYRHMIENFAFYSSPLSDLLKKNAKFVWTSEHQENFEHLRDCLCSMPVLRHPDFKKDFEVHTDACTNSIAGILMQRGKDNIPYPVAYFSRKLRSEETKYPVIELEALAIIASIKNFHYYLYGRKFTIVTDHMPLRTVFENQTKNARISRWALFMQEYDFDCKYKSGKIHHLPDALSRNVASIAQGLLCARVGRIKNKNAIKRLPDDFNTVKTFSAENVRIEQLKEPRWNDLLLFLQGGTVATPPPRTYLDEFAIFDNCLFYSSNKVDDHYRLVVPNSLINEALYICHDSHFTNHFGFVKTLRHARKYFFWPNMIADIKTYCRTCLECQKRKPGKKPFAPLGTFQEVFTILERVGVDLIGPLEVTENGNTFILTVIDHFSRYTEVFPLRSKSSADASNAFLKFLVRHGNVKYLVSDKGTEFLSQTFSGVCKRFGIKMRNTTAFNPKCNGLTKNRNGQIGDILHFLSEQGYLQWDEVLHFVEASLNGSYHPVIQNTPYFLFHARDYVLPYNTVFLQQLTSINYEENNIESVLQRLRDAFESAKISQHTISEYVKRRYDEQARPHTFNIGDFVLIANETKSGPHMRKLNPRFTGPYRITEILSEQTIKVVNLQTPNKSNVVNVNRCKACHLRDFGYPFLTLNIPNDAIVSNDSQSVTVNDSFVANEPTNVCPGSKSVHPMKLRSHSTTRQLSRQVVFADQVNQKLYCNDSNIDMQLHYAEDTIAKYGDNACPIGVIKYYDSL